MHDLTRGDLADAREALVGDMHLVVAERLRPAFLADFRRHGGVVPVLDLEEGPFLVVERQEAVLEDALPDLPHELMVEPDVVTADQGPAQRLLGLGRVMEVSA